MDQKEKEEVEKEDALIFLPLGFMVASAIWFRLDQTTASMFAVLMSASLLLGVLLSMKKVG